MISLSTWNTLFDGKYGSQELTILYSDDYFVSFLKSRDQKDVLLQVYKIFYVKGDIEVFSETLPQQCIVYEKHFDIGEKNTYKFFILNTQIEYIDINSLSYTVDRKIKELNKKASSIVSIIKSYDIKLTSLKFIPEKIKNYFFSDPKIVKVLTNMPNDFGLSSVTSIDKLLLGIKNDVPINTTINDLNKILIIGENSDSRIFATKLICEMYLLSSKKVIIFDSKGVYKSLAYPQQYESILEKFDPLLGAFGFPYKFFKYFEDFKIKLGDVPKNAFLGLFNFSDISKKIISKVYNSDLLDIEELIKKIKNIETDQEITDFEITRVCSKLLLLSKNYNSYFGKTNVSKLFKSKYKHLGSSKIIKIDKKDLFYEYYVYKIIKEISENLKEEILIVLPDLSKILNNMYIGLDIIDILNSNPKINYIISTKYETNIKYKDIFNLKITTIKNNDAVIKFRNRDPLRLLLRPTLSSSNIKLRAN
jgi:hypothetical protein